MGWFVVVLGLMLLHFLFKVTLTTTRHLRYLRAFEKAGIPVRRAHWLWGNTLNRVKNIRRFHDFTDDNFGDSDTYALPMALFFDSIPTYTRDPKMVQLILKDKFDDWSKQTKETPFWRLMDIWIGSGIFTAAHGPHSEDQGKSWYSMRKVAAGIFTRNMFRDMMREIFVEKSRLLRSALLDCVEGKGCVPKDKRGVDMQKMFFGFTMDSIMTIFFGRKTNTMLSEHDEYAEAYDAAHRSLMLYFFSNTLLIQLANVLPFPFGPLTPNGTGLLEPTFRRFISKPGRHFHKMVDVLSKHSYAIIDAKLKQPTLESDKDLLALFMNATDENGVRFADPKHRKFLRDVCMNFIIAGRDTTACTLSWMFYILATNADVQQKLIEELDSVLGRDREPTYDDVAASRMPYLNGVVYETLRIYPPVPFDSKRAYCETMAPDGKPLPIGSLIAYSPFSMGRNPATFPDPLKVKPERWIPFTAPNQFEFPVFQAGPRICLGMNMALLEAKILAVMLLQKLTFTMRKEEADKIGR